MDLSSNKLGTLLSGVFEGLSKAKFLNLADNLLMSLPPGSLTWSLSGNHALSISLQSNEHLECLPLHDVAHWQAQGIRNVTVIANGTTAATEGVVDGIAQKHAACPAETPSCPGVPMRRC